MMKNLEELSKFSMNIDTSIPKLGPDVKVEDHFIGSIDGYKDLRVRIFSKICEGRKLPGILWIHGGGYFGGPIELETDMCRNILSKLDCVIAVVDYRVSIDFPYPIPLEDCYSALKWMDKNRSMLNIGERLAVAGPSAGGGLSIATTLLARDRVGPKIDFLMPLYPMINNSDKAQEEKITDYRMWNDDINQIAWDLYLRNCKDDVLPKYAVPSNENDFSNFPPVYTCVGDLDPFYDETIEFVKKLKKCDVPAELHLYPKCFHGFEQLVPEAKISIKAKNQYLNALKIALE